MTFVSCESCMTFLLSSVLSCGSDVHYVHSRQISWSPERSATPNGCKGKQMEKQNLLGLEESSPKVDQYYLGVRLDHVPSFL